MGQNLLTARDISTQTRIPASLHTHGILVHPAVCALPPFPTPSRGDSIIIEKRENCHLYRDFYPNLTVINVFIKNINVIIHIKAM